MRFTPSSLVYAVLNVYCDVGVTSLKTYYVKSLEIS